MAYQIITDGSCDLGTEIPRQTGIRVVPFYVTFDGQNYKKEIIWCLKVSFDLNTDFF